MSTRGLFKSSREHALEATRLARERKEAEDEANLLEAQLEIARLRAQQKRQEEQQSQDAATQAFQAEHGERQAAFRAIITQGRIDDLRKAIGTDLETVEKIEAVAAGDADAQVLDSFADAVVETLSGDRNQFLQDLAIKMFEQVTTSGLVPTIADEVIPETGDDIFPWTKVDTRCVIRYEPETPSVEQTNELLHEIDGDNQETARSSPAQSSRNTKQPLDSPGDYALTPQLSNTVWNAVDKIAEAQVANAQAASLISEGTQSIEAHAADERNSELTPGIPATSTLPAQFDTKRKRQSTDTDTEDSRTSMGPPTKQAKRFRLEGRSNEFVKMLKDLSPEDLETRFRCAVCSGLPSKTRISKCLHLYCDACWDQRLKKGKKKGFKTTCALDGCMGVMGKKAKMQKAEHPSLAPLRKMEQAPPADGKEDAGGSGHENMSGAEENASQAKSTGN